MVAFSPLSLAGLIVGMLCHTAVVPTVAAPQATQNTPVQVSAHVFQGALPMTASEPIGEPTLVLIPACPSTAPPDAAPSDSSADITASPSAPDISSPTQDQPARTDVRDFMQSTPPAASEPQAAPSVDDASMEITVPSSGSPSTVPTMEAQALELVSLVNNARAHQGEQPLTINPLLNRVALAHSQDMCERGYFDHYAPGPGPSTPMDRYVAALSVRPDYAMVGENIFYRSATDSESQYAAEAHDAFMHSPGHRANILTPQYTSIGVGIYRNPATGEYWVTEMFLRDTP